MTSFWQDLRYAVRMMRKAPGVTVFALLALALGIGVNTSVFCVLSHVLWQRLPIEDPDRVVALLGGREEESRFVGGVSYADYLDVRDQNQVFSGLAASRFTNVALSTSESRRAGGSERGEILYGEFVSGNYFDVLGIPVVLGRTLQPGDDAAPQGEAVVVVSDALWRRRFNADPQILGRSIQVNGMPFTVVGVATKNFKGAVTGVSGDFWAPSMTWTRLADGDDKWSRDRLARDVAVLGRLRPDISIGVAGANVRVIWQNLVNEHPATNKGTTLDVVPEVQARYSSGYDSVRLASLLAQCVAALVLLVSCANVANLLLARAAGRAKEMAIRQALGASRGRLVRQLLTESMLLSLTGGGLGLIVAYWTGDLIKATLPPKDFVQDVDFDPDLHAFGVALGVSLLTGMLFGLAPALRTSLVTIVAALKTDAAAEGQGLGRLGLRQALVIAQLAISIVVVASGALFVRSLRNIEAIDPGFRPDNLYATLLDPGMLEYRGDALRQYFATLQQRVEAIPGVRSVAIASYAPLNGVSIMRPVVKEGDPPAPPNGGMEVTYGVVGARYFETAGSELVLGRDFTPEEHAGTPATAIVNQEMARRLFGDARAALGKRFRAGAADSPLLEIVGVVRDGKYFRLFEDPGPHVFVPEMREDFPDAFNTSRAVLVRAASSRDLPLVIERVRDEVERLDARVAMQVPLAGDGLLRDALYLPRLAAGLGAVLGILALFLSAMGVYSVMAYGVSQRTKEIGIRMALGGQAADVVRLIMRQGMVLVAIGLAVGSAGAFVAGRTASGFLYGVSAADPVAFVFTLTLLALVALLATFVPARRATRVDPMVSLRYE